MSDSHGGGGKTAGGPKATGAFGGGCLQQAFIAILVLILAMAAFQSLVEGINSSVKKSRVTAEDFVWRPRGLSRDSSTQSWVMGPALKCIGHGSSDYVRVPLASIVEITTPEEDCPSQWVIRPAGAQIFNLDSFDNVQYRYRKKDGTFTEWDEDSPIHETEVSFLPTAVQFHSKKGAIRIDISFR